MTQEEATKWLIENWPSIPATILLTSIYLKLRGFANRLTRLEKRTVRIMDVCSAQHPDKGRDLFRDDTPPE